MSLPPPLPPSEERRDGESPEVIPYESPRDPPPVPPEPLEPPMRVLTEAQHRRMTIALAVLTLIAIVTAIGLMAWVSWSFHSQVGTP